MENIGSRPLVAQTVDAERIILMDIDNKKLEGILHMLLFITLFLANQNLSFRGHKEDQSSLNKGNFLGMLGMLSKYDSMMKEHIVRLTRSMFKLRGSLSYLASKTPTEGNNCGNKVCKVL